MRPSIAIAWLVVAVPFAGLAQDMPGIDLSKPPAKSKSPPPPDQGDELPPVDLSAPPAKTSRPAEAQPRQEKEPVLQPLGPSGERDVALGDRVKAVQRKGFLKRHRFDLTPLFALTVNDAFYQKFGGGLRIAYNVQDSLAIAVRGVYYCWPGQQDCTPYRTDAVREGKIAFNSQLLNSQLYGQLMLDGIWSPVYGKAAVLGSTITHFDLFLQAGAGGVWTATSAKPRNEGWHVAADLGGGLRFYPREWLAFELGLTATLYPDQPNPSVPGTLQTIFAATVGVSFFLPTSFEYVYP